MTIPSRFGFVALLSAFVAGMAAHAGYQRLWPILAGTAASANPSHTQESEEVSPVTPSYSVNYPEHQVAAAPPVLAKAVDMPQLLARDLDQIRNFVGREVRVRGRVFRVGHSAKSNTYFINFGPAREALTAVIFASAVELFEKKQLPPRSLENKNIEITGRIKDHPQYGLEVILESPAQVTVLN